MIEPEALVDPEAAPPAPRFPLRRRAAVAGVTLLAVVAGGLAVATGDGPKAEPLALMAGNGAASGVEAMSADAGSATPSAPAAARSSMPYGWGMKFEVVGQLPSLPDNAPSWDVNTPDLNPAAMARIAEALGVTGTPAQHDGGWIVGGGDWTLTAHGGDSLGKGGAWYLNLYRSGSDRLPAPNAGNDEPVGPAISRDDAEQRVRDLLARMGAPRAAWKIETTETEIGVGWACAAPGFNPDELRKMEAEKLAQLDRENATSAGKPAPDAPVAPCAPPPPPVKGFTVALFPLLDGRRADWPVWNVTLRSDGRLENLYGSWVNFERGGDYKLRGVDSALKDLQSPPGVPYPTDSPAGGIEPAIDLPADAGATEPANLADATGSSVSGRRPLRGDVASAPAVDLPADAPVCAMPLPMPMPVEDKGTSSVAAGCAPAGPQVVGITGVELGLIQTPVFEGGKIRLALVPSYRFTGHFGNGQPWETSLLALHPSAIAPPPDLPVDNGARAGGSEPGKAIPPAPAAERTILRHEE